MANNGDQRTASGSIVPHVVFGIGMRLVWRDYFSSEAAGSLMGQRMSFTDAPVFSPDQRR
jgi:hypothetical protein